MYVKVFYIFNDCNRCKLIQMCFFLKLNISFEEFELFLEIKKTKNFSSIEREERYKQGLHTYE